MDLTARALLAVGAALWMLAASAVGARELKVADTHTADYPTVKALEVMGHLLAERSQGKLTLKILHSRLLGEEAETIKHVQVGALDMARVNVTPLNTLVPDTMVLSLPFVFRSTEHLHRVLDGPIGADIAAAFEPHGFVVLAYYDSGARCFYNSRRPIQSPADLKGLRIRVQQSPVPEALVAALGAEAVPLPYGQVQVGLSTGVIDGAENNWPSFYDSRHYTAARFYSATEHSMTPEVVLMSKKVWDTLTPAEQSQLRQAARDSVPAMRALWAEHTRAARDAAVAAGVLINPVDKAAFAQIVQPLYDRFAREPRQKDLLRRILAHD